MLSYNQSRHREINPPTEKGNDHMSSLATTQKTTPIRSVKWLTTTAMLTAMNIALSSFGVPVPGGHLYLCDIVICAAAILLDPFGAAIVGGVGAFIGDFLFYPAPMFVSLVTHGLQAAVISLIVHRAAPEKRLRAAILGVTVGAVIMVIGYTLGRAFIYSTVEYAILKLPFEILQAAVGAVLGTLLCFKGGLLKFWEKASK